MIDRRVAVPALVLLLVPAIGCAAKYPPGGGSSFSSALDGEELVGSLFQEDQALVSNEAIDIILSSEITVAARPRLAVMSFGFYPYWSYEGTRSTSEARRRFLTALRGSDAISRVTFVPSSLTPKEGKGLIARLRAAAARSQSDLLLIYDVQTEDFTKRRFARKNDVKALSVVDAVVLDTRTGLIPFGTSVVGTFTTRRDADDFNLRETIARASAEATGRALEKLVKDLLEFLESS